MAIVNGVAADGSQDFTGLQAWENFADDQVVRHEALVYAGGSVGPFGIAGWSHTLGTKVSPAPGARHDGADGDDNAVAFINQTGAGEVVQIADITGLVEFEGIKVVVDNVNGSGPVIRNNAVVNGNLVIVKNGSVTPTHGIRYRGSALNSKIINNVVIGRVFFRAGIGGENSFLGECSHNTVMGTQAATGIRDVGVGGITNAFNNYSYSWAGTFTNASNNASANASAPGTSPIINVTESNEFTNPQSDGNLLSTSQFRGAAIDRTSISGLERDALNRNRVAPFDIGAIEFGVVGGYQRGRMAPVGARRFASLAGRTL